MYKRFRYSAIFTWAGIPFIAAILIAYWSTLSIVMLGLMAVAAVTGIPSQWRVLRRLRANAYPASPDREVASHDA
ncbi:MAG: hypothetical protein AABM43_03135 [Actinomycetota bacterium]